MTDTGGPAYPSMNGMRDEVEGTYINYDEYGLRDHGMTLLDHFAEAAMVPTLTLGVYQSNAAVAEAAYDLAEAMIAEKRRRDGDR